MNTKQSIVLALCALLSVPAAQALTVTVYNATPYSAEICAGRVLAPTVKVLALPQTKATLQLGATTMKSCYAYISIPDATGKQFTTKETLNSYSAPIGQAVYTDFVLYGPVDGEFYLARTTF